MTAQELIDILSKAKPDAEIEFTLNVSNLDDEDCDVLANFEIFEEDIIDELDFITFEVSPKIKSEYFETIYGLLTECDEVKIMMDKSGIFVFGDGELRRELDYKGNIYNMPSEFIKRIVEVL